ncbi:MAG: RNA pseudouridine synthase [Bdellovibrionaceae bacterium]|nr:RNA pseudouridine synthase [Pseudobdellovibrionaceae bacterium]
MIPILFENSEVVLVDKPAEMLSVPSRFADDPRPILGRVLEEQLGRRLWPVHRLDFEVSGLMAFALSAGAHKKLNGAFERREVHKTYVALAPAVNEQPKGVLFEWRSQILRGKKRSYESEQGQEAITHAEWRREGISAPAGFVNLREWWLTPLTGKPHQLRFEMFKQGLPIVGDELYGSDIPWNIEGIALRAVRVEWPHALASELKLPPVSEVAGFEFTEL